MMPDMVVGSHHLAKSMSHMDFDVVHMSIPWTLGHLLKPNADLKRRIQVWKRGGVYHNDKLLEYVPFVPWPWAISARFLTKERNLHLKFAFFPPEILDKVYDFVYIDDPRFVGLKNIIQSKRWIYRATDVYMDITGDPSRQIAENLLIDDVDKFIATSKPVATHLKKFNSTKEIAIFENGVDFQHFSTAQALPNEYVADVKRVVYAGAIDDRLDLEVLKEIAVSGIDLEVIIIGKASPSIVGLYAKIPNMRFLGPVDYEFLPSYIQHADIAILPLSDHPANDGRSPMKLYEYFASGLPVIAWATSELSRRKLEYCYLYENNGDCLSHVRNIFSSEIGADSCQAVAAAMSWDSITQKILLYSSK